MVESGAPSCVSTRNMVIIGLIVCVLLVAYAGLSLNLAINETSSDYDTVVKVFSGIAIGLCSAAIIALPILYVKKM